MRGWRTSAPQPAPQRSARLSRRTGAFIADGRTDRRSHYGIHSTESGPADGHGRGLAARTTPTTTDAVLGPTSHRDDSSTTPTEREGDGVVSQVPWHAREAARSVPVHPTSATTTPGGHVHAVETQLTVRHVYARWHRRRPDLHQMGIRDARIFDPPYEDPWEPTWTPRSRRRQHIGSICRPLTTRASASGDQRLYDEWSPARAYQHPTAACECFDAPPRGWPPRWR